MLTTLLLLFVSCERQREPDKEEAPLITQQVNKYMLELMEEVYLWEKQIPDTLDVRYEFDEFEFFEKLCYRTEDRWSFITDDVQSLLEGGEGVETTFGYSLAFGTFSNTGNYFAMVQYVYPQTPAAEAGIQRGTIFVEAGGKAITKDNYTTLFYAPALELTLGELKDGTVYKAGTVSLTARKQSLNPVIAHTTITDGANKVGYICYTDFFGGSEDLFFPVFQKFKDEGVTDIVLDLRYNLGGYLSTARALAGVLAPAGCLDGKTVLITKTWNDLYQKYWKDNNRNDMLYEYFPGFSETRLNLNLSRVFILTGKNTASASELTICGLDPYMNVIMIGGVTRGKYTAAMVFHPEENTRISNWGTQPIVYKYANSKGITDFKNGFTPTYREEDVLLGNVYPLGDPREALLARALSLAGMSAQVAPATQTKIQIPNVTFEDSFLSRRPGLSHHLIDK
ncbi:MAG: hypothetical protein LMBGKNDO_00319 [Bacteroidales bacterium]|nr:hypothetical protein [Bacteroidales bacterium]